MTTAVQRAAQQTATQHQDRLATLEHDLRNHVAPIRQALQVLAHPQASPQQHAAALQVIDRQSQALMGLVDGLNGAVKDAAPPD